MQTKNYTYKNPPFKTMYDYYFEKLNPTSHSLEDAFVLAYICLYAENDERTCFFKNRKNREPVLKMIEAKYVSFENFKRYSKIKIDDVLSEALGEKHSLKVFLDPCCYKKSPYYIINDVELAFISYIIANYKSDDTTNFLMHKYHKVSDEYFSYLKTGIDFLIQNHPDKLNKEKIDYRFNVIFGLKQRKIASALKNVENVVKEITDFYLNIPVTEQDCEYCIELLDECEEKLMKMRNTMFPRKQ